jgi:hypothetical protein
MRPELTWQQKEGFEENFKKLRTDTLAELQKSVAKILYAVKQFGNCSFFSFRE